MINIKRLFAILVVSTIFNSTISYAENTPKKGFIDGRMKTVVYNKNDVVNMVGHYGYSTMIEFSDEEEILTISIGDNISWIYTPSGNRLFMKPVEHNANTNMQVITSKRSYNFALTSKKVSSNRNSSLTYTLRFRYPLDEHFASKIKVPKKETEPVIVAPETTINFDQINMEYTRRGSELTAPKKVFDDGKFTYFLFNDAVPEPAIFIVDSDKKETLVNFHKKGKYIVVQRTAGKFSLRYGNDVTCISNKAYLKGLGINSISKDTNNDSEFNFDGI